MINIILKHNEIKFDDSLLKSIVKKNEQILKMSFKDLFFSVKKISALKILYNIALHLPEYQN